MLLPKFKKFHHHHHRFPQNSFAWGSSSLNQLQRALAKSIPSAVKFPSRAAVRPVSSSAVVASKMVKAIRVYELGGPEACWKLGSADLLRSLLKERITRLYFGAFVIFLVPFSVNFPCLRPEMEDVEIGEPKDGEIKVKNKAIGLNFIDTYFRKGVYKASTFPFTPGMEAVGVVTAVGPGLTGRKVGDLVGYAGNPMGAYAEEQILPADKVVPVPPSIDPIIAASVMLKGMTAQFLLRQCFKVEPGHTVLVHAAAGGVGSLLCQWANALGATVIGTVSTEEKAAQAKEDGCHHGSLMCLKLRGYMVSFGQSSGTPDPVPLSALAAKSLFLTRPSMMHYTITRDELLQTASEVFTNLAAGILKVRVNHTYPLSQAAQAHADLESRKTSGSIVLIPDGN
ncbi:Quinone oxidoreductase [Sesamum angolense]|uniref:Quinone oxidoreductase n=1 Tax=Sesamum angolense TaxID=2727404 RepID=A0AAE1W1U4_9LAMI|nr:Quinone oxidoreductase [Sesamum angolense]